CRSGQMKSIRAKLGLPHEQEEQSIRGRKDPRFQQSPMGDWERSTAASRRERKLRWRAEARKERLQFRVSDGFVGDVHLFTFFSFFSETENGPNANPN